MKKTNLILLILISFQTFAEEPLFKQANEKYASEKYSEAISIYDSIISSGFESSEIYYNLGNCYYKKEDWANTIWNYERSLKLKRESNTLYNLEITKLKIIDKIEPTPKLFYKTWWQNIITLFTTKTWQILTLVCIWTTLITQRINKTKKIKRYLLHFLNTTSLILLLISHSSYEENYNKSEAIIFSSSVIVNSAPTEKSTDLFSLHSGTKIELIDEIGDWINIKLENGSNGWIKKSNCKTL